MQYAAALLVLAPLAAAQSISLTITEGITTSIVLPAWTTSYAATVTSVVSTGNTTTTVFAAPTDSVSGIPSNSANATSVPLLTTSTGLSPAGSSYVSSLLSAETSSAAASSVSITATSTATETSTSSVIVVVPAPSTFVSTTANATVVPSGVASGTGVVGPTPAYTGAASQVDSQSVAALAVIFGFAAWVL